MEENKINLSFPLQNEFSEKYLRENFWKCIYTSAANELHYWVILPNNVKPVNLDPVKLNNIGLTTIGQYIRIDDSPYLEVQVVYEYCPFEMNISDWLLKKLHIMNEAIIDQRLIKGKSTGTYLDALTYKVINNENEVISRCTVLKDSDKKKGGANYFCIRASCHLNEYEKLSNNILQIITNWDIINKTDWQMAETLKPFLVPFVEKVEFYIPNSWDIAFNNENTNSQARFVFSHTIENQNKGVINAFFYEINVFRNQHEVFNKSIERLINMNGFESELSELNTMPIEQIDNPSIKECYVASGVFTYSKENFSAFVQLFIFKTITGWYYFESVGPKLNLENYYWEANKRCLEIIRDSFNNLEFTKRQKEVLPNKPKKPSNGYIIVEDEIKRKRKGFWGF